MNWKNHRAGPQCLESIIETKASTILQFFAGLRGDLHVTFEEGISSPSTTEKTVCGCSRRVLP
jgi:hypothetical protein